MENRFFQLSLHIIIITIIVKKKPRLAAGFAFSACIHFLLRLMNGWWMYEIRVESSRRPPQAGGGMHTNNISDAASFFPSAAAPFSLDFLLLRLRKHCLLFLLVLFVIIIHIHRSCGLLFLLLLHCTRHAPNRIYSGSFVELFSQLCAHEESIDAKVSLLRLLFVMKLLRITTTTKWAGKMVTCRAQQALALHTACIKNPYVNRCMWDPMEHGRHFGNLTPFCSLISRSQSSIHSVNSEFTCG